MSHFSHVSVFLCLSNLNKFFYRCLLVTPNMLCLYVDCLSLMYTARRPISTPLQVVAYLLNISKTTEVEAFQFMSIILWSKLNYSLMILFYHITIMLVIHMGVRWLQMTRLRQFWSDKHVWPDIVHRTIEIQDFFGIDCWSSLRTLIFPIFNLSP